MRIFNQDRSLLVQVKIMRCPNDTAVRRSVTLFCDLTVVSTKKTYTTLQHRKSLKLLLSCVVSLLSRSACVKSVV